MLLPAIFMSMTAAKKASCAVKYAILSFSQTAFAKKAKPGTGVHIAEERFTDGKRLIPTLFISVETRPVHAV
jgi:hypothetical protein